jgi:hypothetical protein
MLLCNLLIVDLHTLDPVQGRTDETAPPNKCIYFLRARETMGARTPDCPDACIVWSVLQVPEKIISAPVFFFLNPFPALPMYSPYVDSSDTCQSVS